MNPLPEQLLTMNTQYDSTLLGILQNEGKVLGFLDAVYGFLYRRTDYYIIRSDKDGKMGFPPGMALKLSNAVFSKYSIMAKADQEHRQKQMAEQREELPKGIEKEVEIETEDTVEVKTEPSPKAVKSHIPSPPPPQPVKPAAAADGDEQSSDKPSQQDDKHEDGEDAAGKGGGATAKKKNGDKSDDEDPELTRMQKIYQDNPYSHNGAIRDNYSWGQSITDVDVHIKIPPTVKKGNECQIIMERDNLKVSYRGEDGEMVTAVDDKLSWPVNLENSLWTLIPGDHIHINLEKMKERWWESVLVSEPKISVRKIDPSRPMTDLDDESQSKIHEMMYNQRQKEMGLPQSHEQKTHDMLKQAWDADGSPFKGQPFDTSTFKFS